MNNSINFDLIIIGSGIAGTHAALLASEFNLNIAIIEANLSGGSSLNDSDLPINYLLEAANFYNNTLSDSRHYHIRADLTTFNFPQIINQARKITDKAQTNYRTWIQNNRITYINGYAYFLNPDTISVNKQHYTAKKFLITSGANWSTPAIPGLLDAQFYTPKTILKLPTLSNSVLIIGGHPSALRLAYILASFGTRVQFVTKNLNILPDFDAEFGILLEKKLAKHHNISISTSSQVLAIRPKAGHYHINFSHAGIEREVEVDEIIVAEELQPETDLGLLNAVVQFNKQGIITNSQLQTSNQNIYAAGDVLGVKNDPLAAMMEAELAIKHILKKTSQEVSYQIVPEVVNLDLILAKVGFTSQDCVATKQPFTEATTKFREVPRQAISPAATGMLKLIVDQHQKIIGAQVAGPEANSIINQLSLAIKQGLTIKQLLAIPQAFLSWQEIINITANKLLKK